jgi:hypothetical protein
VRVNVDGRFVAYMKRNLLEGNLHPVNAGALPRYKLNELLGSKKVRTTKFRGIDLITADERIVRLSPDEAKDLEFALQRHGGGIADIYFAGHTVQAKALNVYVRNDVSQRPMRTLAPRLN